MIIDVIIPKDLWYRFILVGLFWIILLVGVFGFNLEDILLTSLFIIGIIGVLFSSIIMFERLYFYYSLHYFRFINRR